MGLRPFDLLIVTFGDGDAPPYMTDWLTGLMPEIVADERIGRCETMGLCNTSVTMRERATSLALQGRFDLLLMVNGRPDSPDPLHWQWAMDYICQHHAARPSSVGALYRDVPPPAGMRLWDMKIFRGLPSRLSTHQSPPTLAPDPC